MTSKISQQNTSWSWSQQRHVFPYLVPVSCVLEVVEPGRLGADVFAHVVGDEELEEVHDDEHDAQDQHYALEHVPITLQKPKATVRNLELHTPFVLAS